MNNLLNKTKPVDDFDSIIRRSYAKEHRVVKSSIFYFALELGITIAAIYLLIGVADRVWYLLTCC